MSDSSEKKDEETKYDYLYPTLDDPDFSLKIASRKEFYDTRYNGEVDDVEKMANKICSADFELSPHQLFVHNFLSFQTPYNSLLLYHGLGTGKTCSAIGVGEEMRDYLRQMGISQRIFVVASPNVQENFKLQLFDERKLKEIDGLWNIQACTGNKFIKELNPMNMRGLSKERVVRQIKRIISDSYLFLGYVEFANYIAKKKRVNNDIGTEEQQKARSIAKLKKHFSNRLIIIDEVHNIRTTDDNSNKRVALELYDLVNSVKKLRLLLLSATPMYNSYKEIVWLINLMNINDERPKIVAKNIFNKDGTFKTNDAGEEIGKEILIRKSIGYISFIRGENPYAFPYRIWPKEFDPAKTFGPIQYPRLQLNGQPLAQRLEIISLYLSELGTYQQKGYNYILERLHKGDYNMGNKEMPSFENMESFGYTILQKPLEGLNIIYPDDRLDKNDTAFDARDLVGKNGLSRLMKYTESGTPIIRQNFEYRNPTKPKVFSRDELKNYSGKLNNICDAIMNSTGVVLVYSQYIDGGLVPLALALEERGFLRVAPGRSLFKDAPSEKLDAVTMTYKDTIDAEFKQAKYSMITGDKTISPDNVAEFKSITNESNKEGHNVKVVLISQAGSEGLDFKFIRQVHVLEPWYNMNRIEQIIGRAVRHCSHKALPFIDRNVQIFLHGSVLQDKNIEAADIYVYRLAEIKAIQIGRVSRVLKESAVDCLLNISQTNFTFENMKQTVKQKLSNKNVIDYIVGDKPYSATCDYMDTCSYTCKPNPTLDDSKINLNTFSEAFITMNSEKILQRIRQLMKERHYYKKSNLISQINVLKEYPLIQINSALNQLVNDRNEYVTDKYERLGRLVNIEDLYLFQPIELDDPSISIHDRSIPIPYKRDKLNYTINLTDSKEITPAIVPLLSTQKEEPEPVASSVANKIKELYELANTTHVIVRGDTDWYKYFHVGKDLLKNEGASEEILNELLIQHIIEELLFEDQLMLINEVTQLPEDEVIRMIKNYFKNITMKSEGGELEGIILQQNGEYKLIVKNRENAWKLGENQDYKDLKSELSSQINLLIPADKHLASHVGFMTSFKKKQMIFKVKDMDNVRNRGARCDQVSKIDNLRILNKIIGKEKYTKQMKIHKYVICILQEFYLRWFENQNKNNKKWFVTPGIAALINIETIHY